MTFAFVNSSGVGSASTNTLVSDRPSGVVDGDILFTYINRNNSSYPISVPSGWNLIGIGARDYSWVYWKIADNEPSTWTWIWAASVLSRITVVAYRGGFNANDPIDDHVTSDYEYDSATTTLRSTTLTVANSNSPLLFFGRATSTDAVTCTAPSELGTWDEDYDDGDTDSDRWNFIYRLTWSGIGATGNIDATLSSANLWKTTFLIALNPSSSGFGAAQRRMLCN